MARGGAPRGGAATLARIASGIVRCRACPRLVAWREAVAREKRRAYRDEVYWGRPVPGFGDPGARIAIVGLAPGAHGANRTGRMFTGDGSGDFLYAALHRAGLASQAASVSREDGLRLSGVFVTAAARCAPPENRPTPAELRRCAPFLDRELAALGSVRVLLALGAIAWEACLGHLARTGRKVPAPRPRFGHGVELRIPGGPVLVGSYHVSRQNTQTGRLTPAMFDAALARAVQIARGRRARGQPSAPRPRERAAHPRRPRG
jgi:uracil-DNA glycosylase family 4